MAYHDYDRRDSYSSGSSRFNDRSSYSGSNRRNSRERDSYDSYGGGQRSYSSRGKNSYDSYSSSNYSNGGDRMRNGNFGESLPSQNWDSSLPKFEKNFYHEHPAIQQLSPQEVAAFRDEHDIVVKGNDIPKPVRTFEEASFPSKILSISF